MYLFVFVPRDSTVTYTFDANSRLCVVLCCCVVVLCEGVSAELVSNKTKKQAAKRVICGGGLEMQAGKRS